MQPSQKITTLNPQLHILQLLLFVLLCISVNAQERSAFRPAYIRLGFNQLGGSLNSQLSPKQNIFEGNFGTSPGFVFETGRVFYFMNSSAKRLVNAGLDWTYISLNYNKMDQWDTYGRNAAGSTEYTIDGTKIAAAISGKLGPVLSINPVEKLVIDIRAQIAPTIRYFDLDYAEYSNGNLQRAFSFTNEEDENDGEDFNAESVKNRIAFGFQRSFGLTVRRKAIGLSIDYVSGNVKSSYTAIDQSGRSNGKDKIPVSNLQFKISLTL